MKKCLIYEDDNGQCRIIVPNPEFKQAWESEQAAIGRLVSITVPDIIELIACTPDKIPTDLTFRDAWRKGNKDNPIRVDLEKAIEIHRGRIKKAADAKIDSLQSELKIATLNQNLPEQVALKATMAILAKIHNLNLTHCKSIEDVKYSIPKELHDVWDFYPPSREM